MIPFPSRILVLPEKRKKERNFNGSVIMSSETRRLVSLDGREREKNRTSKQANERERKNYVYDMKIIAIAAESGDVV